MGIRNLPVALTLLGLLAPLQSHAAGNDEYFRIVRFGQGYQLFVGKNKWVDVWLPTGPGAQTWKVGDTIEVRYSPTQGLIAENSHLRQAGRVIGLHGVADPISAELKRCLAAGQRTNLQAKLCYADAATAWRSIVAHDLQLADEKVPASVMVQASSGSPFGIGRGVTAGAVKDAAQAFTQAMDQLVVTYQGINYYASYDAGTGWDVAAASNEIKFLKQEDQVILDLVRRAALSNRKP